MKKLILKISTILIISVGLSGCYTIVWTPKDNFPTAKNSNSEDYGYYSSPYFGEYYYYYDYPWWYSIQPPAQTYVRDSNQGQETVRNGISGRGESSVRTGILQTPPPTISSPAVSSGSTSSTPKNSSSGNRVESTSSGNNNTSRSTNSNNNTLRNNNGGRNNNGRK